MKTIAVIPARGGSKRLPKKNIKLLGSIPLLVHSILYAQKHRFIDAIYVSTDDVAVRKTASDYGAFVIDRPKNISGDFEPTISAIKHVLESIDTVENVVILQPTNPLRPEKLLADAFAEFNRLEVNSLFTVSESHHKLGKIHHGKFMPLNYEFGQRSQDLEPLYFENGLLYITKAKTILDDKIISMDALPYIVDHIFTNIDIDTQEDFYYAEFIINQYGNK